MADNSIQSLKDKVANNGGLQRNNRFIVYIDPNSSNSDVNVFFRGRDQGNTPKSYFAESVIFPDVSLTTQADGLAGPGLGRTSPRGLSYSNGLMITFPVFGDLKLIDNMNSWIKSFYSLQPIGGIAQGQGTAWVTSYYENIKNSYINIDVLDLNGNATGTYKFKETFPVEIAPIEFSMMSGNEYLKLMVRFAFRDYYFELNG